MNEVEWRNIGEFPNYAVSETGLVRNEDTGHVLCRHKNQAGVVHVNLNRRGIQHRRSLALLVAREFIPVKVQSFTSPINLDGDRFNNCVENLAWRPRWFAIEYFRQFRTSAPAAINKAMEELRTGEQFESSWHAALKYGLLDREILASILNRTYVWPTFQRFRICHRTDTN